METNRIGQACLIAYVVIGIMTFGHCAANTPMAVSGDRAIAGIIAAPLWPLYWSWELFE